MIVKCEYKITYCDLLRHPVSVDDDWIVEGQCVEADVQKDCKRYEMHVDKGGCKYEYMSPITVIRKVESVDIYQEYVEFGDVYVPMQDLVKLEINYEDGRGYETELEIER